MSEEQSFSVSLKLLENYLFQIDFGEFGDLLTDEPEPLGGGEGPNPMRLLAAAIANCLTASLLFAIRKFKEEPGEARAQISGVLERDGKFWRVRQMHVDLHLGNVADEIPHLQRALEQFENFCVVTQSVRDGIKVDVNVFDAGGELVHSHSG